jgi:hypothetical protein
MGHHYRAAAVIMAVTLSACAANHYQNSVHPNYGDAEYNADLAQCRKENSTITTIQGYDLQTHIDVDEAKAASCMTARGWEKTSAGVR